ncbi:MAG: matrixin family metalloprotease [Chloroflexi bacterium]|nr:matrixin family metalloprotease [Chloroflexota bacterium]
MHDRRLVLPVLILTLSLFLPARAALAWNPIGPTWPDPTATYDTHTLTSSWRGVADFGAQQWDLVSPSPWDWVSNPSSNNDIYTGRIDGRGRTLAVTYTYYQGSTITRSTIKFDSSERWYLGSGNPAGNQVDGRSVAAHEFGHALGLGHTGGGFCPGNANNATLCPAYTMGTIYIRSLEADDRNGVNSLYP